ncbi:MAG: Lrp/AsnC family transcriptional regulator [Caldithrix sp.]|nr:MAG: Lrp/AsnC family transcriptional regulator [Caldithrix sp.]
MEIKQNVTAAMIYARSCRRKCLRVLDSHLLKVRTANTAALEQLLSRIQAWPGVLNTRTDIVLSSPKETTVLPLQQVERGLNK